ncbi:LOW QUALITY PROTEIN: Cold shock domain-containing protein E1, partial [Galemys pyrenaicus]
KRGQFYPKTTSPDKGKEKEAEDGFIADDDCERRRDKVEFGISDQQRPGQQIAACHDSNSSRLLGNVATLKDNCGFVDTANHNDTFSHYSKFSGDVDRLDQVWFMQRQRQRSQCRTSELNTPVVSVSNGVCPLWKALCPPKDTGADCHWDEAVTAAPCPLGIVAMANQGEFWRALSYRQQTRWGSQWLLLIIVFCAGDVRQVFKGPQAAAAPRHERVPRNLMSFGAERKTCPAGVIDQPHPRAQP